MPALKLIALAWEVANVVTQGVRYRELARRGFGRPPLRSLWMEGGIWLATAFYLCPIHYRPPVYSLEPWTTASQNGK